MSWILLEAALAALLLFSLMIWTLRDAVKDDREEEINE